MTLHEPSLFLNRLVVFGRGRPVYDEEFRLGVNIIRGSNSSGKSTITDFIFFVLGGDISAWKPEAERCDYVMAEVAVNGKPLTLRRQITANARQSMEIFWVTTMRLTVRPLKAGRSFLFSAGQKRKVFRRCFSVHWVCQKLEEILTIILQCTSCFGLYMWTSLAQSTY
jgi:hypothetical protein